MAFSMLPSIIVEAVTDLTPEMLSERGIELLMLDFDNTIVPYTTNIPEPLMEQWLYDMKQSDIKLCIVSNSKNQRVRIFCKNYGLDCITHAKKPFPKGFLAWVITCRPRSRQNLGTRSLRLLETMQS